MADGTSRTTTAEPAIHRLGGATVEQARGTALGCGVLGNQVFGQSEIEVAQGEGARGGARGKGHDA